MRFTIYYSSDPDFHFLTLSMFAALRPTWAIFVELVGENGICDFLDIPRDLGCQSKGKHNRACCVFIYDNCITVV